MENSRYKFVESFIGKHFTKSPSPFAHWLNGKVIALKKNSLEFSFVVRKDMTNPVGMLHGGVISGMIDDCMGVTFFTLGLEYFYPSINLQVDFFNPAKEGEEVRVKTQVMKQGKTIINMRAEVYNISGKLLATATSNLAKSNFKIDLQL
ncbi:PaaI family thioesterase [Winogradskyella sp.]|uniref:PaaI family thioesterase n=1 Tax=Winogradskyella sp. TaxID=1883156 RepID=UPI003AB70834